MSLFGADFDKPCRTCRWCEAKKPTKAETYHCRRPDESDTAGVVTGRPRHLDRPCFSERSPERDQFEVLRRSGGIPLPSSCGPNGRYWHPKPKARRSRAAEDAKGIADAKAALADPDGRSWAEAKADMGLTLANGGAE